MVQLADARVGNKGSVPPKCEICVLIYSVEKIPEGLALRLISFATSLD